MKKRGEVKQRNKVIAFSLVAGLFSSIVTLFVSPMNGQQARKVAGKRVRQFGDKLGEVEGKANEKLSEIGQSANKGATNFASKVTDGASKFADNVSDRLHAAKTNFERGENDVKDAAEKAGNAIDKGVGAAKDEMRK